MAHRRLARTVRGVPAALKQQTDSAPLPSFRPGLSALIKFLRKFLSNRRTLSADHVREVPMLLKLLDTIRTSPRIPRSGRSPSTNGPAPDGSCRFPPNDFLRFVLHDRTSALSRRPLRPEFASAARERLSAHVGRSRSDPASCLGRVWPPSPDSGRRARTSRSTADHDRRIAGRSARAYPPQSSHYTRIVRQRLRSIPPAKSAVDA